MYYKHVHNIIHYVMIYFIMSHYIKLLYKLYYIQYASQENYEDVFCETVNAQRQLEQGKRSPPVDSQFQDAQAQAERGRNRVDRLAHESAG